MRIKSVLQKSFSLLIGNTNILPGHNYSYFTYSFKKAGYAISQSMEMKNQEVGRIAEIM